MLRGTIRIKLGKQDNYWLLLKCPNCKINFHPQLKYAYMGQNRAGVAGALYWQTCPGCDKFLVCIRESIEGNEVLGDLDNINGELMIYPVRT
ncbi:MAG: hypothetical protein WBZ36_09160 [Candidatus Nitrosopolaris sp.]